MWPYKMVTTISSFCFASLSSFFILIAIFGSTNAGKYLPNWDSIDQRPLPAWYDESKIGIFIHWGVFSVPSYGSEWFWRNWHDGQSGYVEFMKKNYRPDFTYADFARDFTCEFFNATQWVDTFKASGAKYVVMTTKHHEGFDMWPSKYAFNWNSAQVGPKRDLVGELAQAVRNSSDLRFGLYHSLYEFYNPLFLQDQTNNWTTQNFVFGKTIPELYELIYKYKPEVLWSDGQWMAPDWYWNSTDFLAWLYNESPVKDTIVTNDRWGSDTECKHGGYFTCEDRYNPGKLQLRKWENAMTLDRGSWGYRRDVDFSSYLTFKELVTTLAETISCGGNLLMNVGPTKDGRIMPIFEERLRELGDWLSVNGEAIYDSRPWLYQNDTLTPGIWYTAKKNAQSSSGYDVYAIVLDWPLSNRLPLAAPVWTANTNIFLLGWNEPLTFTSSSVQDVLLVNMPLIPFNKMPSMTAWVLKLTNLLY